MLVPGTSWRQGHVLKHDDAVSLGLLKPDETNQKVVVITHDCDLQSNSEKNVELMVGPLKKGSSQMKRAKHPRILDLCFENPENNNKNAIELKHERKHILPKQNFQCEVNDNNFNISAEEKQGLKQWLAAKYGRPAFPNAFEERLRAFDDGKKIIFEKEVATIIAANAEHLIGIFFDLGEDRFNDLDEGTPYEISIIVVYDAVTGGPDARKCAEETSSNLKTLFTQFYGDPTLGHSELISLDKCSAVADINFSLYALRTMDQWRIEYISIEDETLGDFIGAGL
ncbi:hypothetical protein [Shewanella morhuae]|uniref:Uncharacterized protein n=1 Tax=Shewanella morhuae TaxID=365591 RepID=A0A380AZJ0_9GAMM|nr:hypothetical protein [Shewanella morhuae]SUI90716.1 Uncharacterised protein [Shewanella morhuae]